jgi:hypothetical protein
MDLVELARSLPWGLHDASLEALEVDWLRGRLALTLRLVMSERQDLDRRARIDLEGLVYCSIEPPEIDPAGGYEPLPDGGLRISEGPGPAVSRSSLLPATPPGCFLHWLYVGSWNRFIHLCAREARLTWLEEAPVPARATTRALFPGDEVPDPGSVTPR